MRASASELVVRTHRLGKAYRLGTGCVQALRSVDLSIRTGEFVGIMGRSGSGKSTLLNIIGLLDRPDAGTYHLSGIDALGFGAGRKAELRNRLIGFVFQQHNLLPRYSALANVELPLAYAGVPRRERRRRAFELLDALGLADKAPRLPGQLSGGEAQRTAIARALINDPKLLLADEPTGALDSRTAQEVLELFCTLNAAGRTVVIVTHDLEVARHARRVIAMRDGRIAGSFDLPGSSTIRSAA